MNRYSTEEKQQAIDLYFKNGCNNQGDRNGGHLIGYGGLISVPVAQ